MKTTVCNLHVTAYSDPISIWKELVKIFQDNQDIGFPIINFLSLYFHSLGRQKSQKIT